MKGVPFRLTPQRKAILEVLRTSHDHPTATEIYLRAKALYPALSFATVYNTLNYLKKTGWVRELQGMSEAHRYDFNHTPHHHLICVECGQIVDLPPSPQRSSLPTPPGWEVQEVEIMAKGVCPACQKRTEKGNGDPTP